MARNLNEILNEVNLSSLNRNKISRSKIKVDKPCVFITVPSPDLSFSNEIYNTDFYLLNCKGVISPSHIVKVGHIRINAKQYYLNLKREMMGGERSTKKLPVTDKVPELSSIKNNDFYFYDFSAYVNAISKFSEKYSEKILSKFLFENLSKIYRGLKNRNFNIQHELLFLCKNNDNLIANIFKNVKINLPKNYFKDLDLFDSSGFFSNLNGITAPIFGKENGDNIIFINNLRKSLSQLEDIEKEELQTNKSDENMQKDNKIISDIVKGIKLSGKDSFVDDKGNIKIELNAKQLTKALKEHDIENPDIIVNIKNAIEQYIKETNKKPTKDEAEIIVLRAINHTVHGTDEINDEYMNDPKKLVKKLEQQQTHQTPLELSDPDEVSIDPKDIITINHTTGAWRQKKEFEETIHKNVEKLFQTLENTTDKPVEVKSIDHEVIDDNANRHIKYTVTLQNKSGGKKDPYKVNFYVPGIVSDRYFKLNGNNYVIGNQHFLKPVTKTVKNDVRVLSNYAIVRLGLERVKFNPSEIENIIEYARIRYANLIKEVTDEYCLFNDNSKLFLSGTDVYEDDEIKITTNDDNRLVDNEGNELNHGRYEYQYEVMLKKIQTVNPEDRLTKTKKSIPYVLAYISSIRIPFIYYLWQIKGLLTALNDLGIDYEIKDNVEDEEADYVLETKDGKYLVIRPETIKGKYVCNGLIALRPKTSFKNFEDVEEIQTFIEKNFGTRSTYYLNNLTENEIDPITKELLEFENLPTNLPNLLSTHCLDVLFNEKPDSVADLKIYRSRMSEVILNIMYSQITMAHNRYRDKVNYGDEEAKLEFQSDYVINDIIMEPGVLQESQPINPVQEIELSSRTYKTGPGGVKSQVSFSPAHRNVHSSQIGTMSATTTSESDKVGLNVSHTLTPTIINLYGSYGYKDLASIDGWRATSINEALVPFQNQIDSDRMVMSSRHTGQVTPTDGNEAPLVGTGAEFIVPQLSSSRFVQTAKDSGEVIEVVPNKTITVKYKDGSTKVFDIMPRNSKTKMGGNILLEMQTLQKGDKFKKNQIIAWTKNFNKNGMYSPGKNAFMAVMNYSGFSHEDAYCVTENIANSMTRDIVRESQALIPPGTKIIKLEKQLKEVNKNDVLVEFTYQDDLESYLQMNPLETEEEDEEVLSAFTEGENSIKLMAEEGEIVDIKVFINNKASVDKQVVNFHKELVQDVNEVRKKLEDSYSEEDDKVKAIDNMDLSFTKTGGHKLRGGTEFQGARIVYYIRQKIELIDGDKLATRYGAKGVISKVIPENQTPYTETGNKIDVFISPTGVFSRKNIAMIKELYLGKILYYLNRKAKEFSEDENKKEKEILDFIIKVYDLLGNDDVKKSVENKLSHIGEGKIKKRIKDDKLKFYYTVAPFENVTFDDIKKAADYLNISLDEYVYMPEYDMWTKNAVPCGISYIQALEQTADFYSNVRSMGKYQSITGQAVKGKSVEGGQSFGALDLNAMLTTNADNLIDELMSLRADEHQGKRQVINSIINNGKANLPRNIREGETSNLMNVYIRSMGLNVE
ncbi:MAG: hypothetical protein ACOC22_03640 [bacterium]